MSEPTRIPAPDGVRAAAQYSHVAMGTGRFVAIAGQLALDEQGRPVGEGDPAAQARQAARAEHIPDDRLPAASAVRVARLVRPEFLLEVEAPPLPRGVGVPPAVVAE
ncbi:Rid family hydrolase [Streptomyces coeruleorubidus]|uniref:Rid family hydrolase n=1 Tax=Streptomyces coeruleorubidus TaxID=116188 RepID=UPI003787EA0F